MRHGRPLAQGLAALDGMWQCSMEKEVSEMSEENGKKLDMDFARDARVVGKWNAAAIEDRRRQVFELMLRGISETVIARQFGVHRNTIVNDVREIRRQNRRKMEEAQRDSLSEIGKMVGEFDEIMKIAMFEAASAKRVGGKAMMLGVALKALVERSRLLIETGILPSAAIEMKGEIAVRLSDGRDLRRMSLEELKRAFETTSKRIGILGGN